MKRRAAGVTVTVVTTALVVVAAASLTFGLGPARRAETSNPRPLSGSGSAKGQVGEAQGARTPGVGLPGGGDDLADIAGTTRPMPGGGSDMYKQRGVALGMFAEDIGFSYAGLLREIAALGATHVALVIPLYQTNGRTVDLGMHTRYSPTLGLVADAIRAARRERLEVTVFPIVRLAEPAPGEWRGTLAPRNVRQWFRRYGELLGDLAAVAAQTGASRLVIGSELSTLDGRLEEWRPLLERIRAVFAGRLMYSANWDHFRDVPLFDLVDEDGVVAYFPLRTATATATAGAGKSSSVDDLPSLVAAWRALQNDILTWHQSRSHPLVFTELGYRSRKGATLAPWDESGGGVVDVDEQRRAFAAFHGVWTGNAKLAGVYIWNWYGWGGPLSRGYTPRGKPAADEIRSLLKDL